MESGVGQLQCVSVSDCSDYIQLLSVYLTPGICTDLPSLTNGDITYSTGSPDNRPVNTDATHTCDNGYILSGNLESNRVCANGGIWSGSPLTCISECISYIGVILSTISVLFSLQSFLLLALIYSHRLMEYYFTIMTLQDLKEQWQSMVVMLATC